jgi:hypothetical protein
LTAKPPYRIALFAVLAALVLAIVPAAVGARGGGGSGGAPTATIDSDCNPCAVGTIAHFTGSGYDPSEPRGMAAVKDSAGNTNWVGINISPDGTTSFELYMSPAGRYDITVLQNQRKRLVLKAELTGLVVR